MLSVDCLVFNFVVVDNFNFKFPATVSPEMYMWTMDTQISLHIHKGLIRVAMACQYIVNYIINLIIANDGCVRYTIRNTDLGIDSSHISDGLFSHELLHYKPWHEKRALKAYPGIVDILKFQTFLLPLSTKTLAICSGFTNC